MNRLRIVLSCAITATLVCAAPSDLRSQIRQEQAVRAVVDSFFAAVARERWEAAAAFVDATRFEPYFKQIVSNARTALPQRATTVEDMMAGDSTMPRAVAEWEVARSKKYSSMQPGFGDMSYELAGIHSQSDLFALTPSQALARWIEAQDERTQMRESWRRSGCSLSDLPAFPGAKRNVLAVAIVNDSLAYAVHNDDRFTGVLPASLFGTERVVPVHRVNGSWRLEARADLMRLANMGFSFAQDCPKIKKP